MELPGSSAVPSRNHQTPTMSGLAVDGAPDYLLQLNNNTVRPWKLGTHAKTFSSAEDTETLSFLPHSLYSRSTVVKGLPRPIPDTWIQRSCYGRPLGRSTAGVKTLPHVMIKNTTDARRNKTQKLVPEGSKVGDAALWVTPEPLENCRALSRPLPLLTWQAQTLPLRRFTATPQAAMGCGDRLHVLPLPSPAQHHPTPSSCFCSRLVRLAARH